LGWIAKAFSVVLDDDAALETSESKNDHQAKTKDMMQIERRNAARQNNGVREIAISTLYNNRVVEM
jgi:hypothetical protein